MVFVTPIALGSDGGTGSKLAATAQEAAVPRFYARPNRRDKMGQPRLRSKKMADLLSIPDETLEILKKIPTQTLMDAL